MNEQDAIQTIAKTIHSRIANLTNVSNALHVQKAKNVNLVKALKRIRTVCDSAIANSSVQCPLCKMQCTSEHGLKLHTGRMHKEESV